MEKCHCYIWRLYWATSWWRCDSRCFATLSALNGKTKQKHTKLAKNGFGPRIVVESAMPTQIPNFHDAIEKRNWKKWEKINPVSWVAFACPLYWCKIKHFQLVEGWAYRRRKCRASRVAGIWRSLWRTCCFPSRSWRLERDCSCREYTHKSLWVILVLIVSYLRNARSNFLTFSILKNKKIPCKRYFYGVF